MHAGDGNIHVNIPVFSNDRAMMKRAEKTAEDIMAKAVELGGVVSGEHGIGITKMKFLEKSRLEELRRYRQEVDPQGIMNPGMLNDPAIIDKVFTPSFNLLELEAKILQYGSLAKLSSMISKCIRCGKCMPVCCVYHPGSNIFFHPRNKNMVIGSLIEALLYDMQRSHLPRFNQLKNLEEIADHCTMCRKCLAPCPVDIDTAEVSLLEREILSDLSYKHTAPATLMSLYYLKIRNRSFNKVFRKGVLEWGGDLQRLAAQAYKKAPPALTDKKWRFLNMFKSPMMPASTTSLGDRLPYFSEREALMIQPGRTGRRKPSFISPAAARNASTPTSPPPPSICWRKTISGSLSRRCRNAAVFRPRSTPRRGWRRSSACGTPSSSPRSGRCSAIWCSTPFSSVAAPAGRPCTRWVSARSSTAPWPTSRNSSWKTRVGQFGARRQETVLYHTPCHDSFDGAGAGLLGQLYKDVRSVANCCSEAGTLAVSRPDIAHAMLERKRESLVKAGAGSNATIIATNCPSCLSGLGRNREMGITPQHMAVVLAEAIGGPELDERFYPAGGGGGKGYVLEARGWDASD